MKLEVGCGEEPTGQADVAVDLRQTDAADLQADALRLPFQDDSFASAQAHHVIEHCDPAAVLGELQRVVKPWGYIGVRVPLGRNAAEDPSHQVTDWTPTLLKNIVEGLDWSDGVAGLNVINISVEPWLSGPLRPLSPLFELAAPRWPEWTARHADGGELRATLQSNNPDRDFHERPLANGAPRTELMADD
jgi:SAM-dependent methyltransferase